MSDLIRIIYGFVAFLAFFTVLNVSKTNDELLEVKINRLSAENNELSFKLNELKNNFSIVTSLSEKQKEDLELYKTNERINVASEDVLKIKELLNADDFDEISIANYKRDNEFKNKIFEKNIDANKEYLNLKIDSLDEKLNLVLAVFFGIVSLLGVVLFKRN